MSSIFFLICLIFLFAKFDFRKIFVLVKKIEIVSEFVPYSIWIPAKLDKSAIGFFFRKVFKN